MFQLFSINIPSFIKMFHLLAWLFLKSSEICCMSERVRTLCLIQNDFSWESFLWRNMTIFASAWAHIQVGYSERYRLVQSEHDLHFHIYMLAILNSINWHSLSMIYTFTNTSWLFWIVQIGTVWAWSTFSHIQVGYSERYRLSQSKHDLHFHIYKLAILNGIDYHSLSMIYIFTYTSWLFWTV